MLFTRSTYRNAHASRMDDRGGMIVSVSVSEHQVDTTNILWIGFTIFG